MFKEEIKKTRHKLNELALLQREYEQSLAVLIKDDLSRLSNSNFLDLIEQSFKSRLVENPCTPNEIEIQKVYNLLTGK